jgi:hypothetical protein
LRRGKSKSSEDDSAPTNNPAEKIEVAVHISSYGIRREGVFVPHIPFHQESNDVEYNNLWGSNQLDEEYSNQQKT